MATARIRVKLGAMSFSGEGESAWVAEQLDKVLGALPPLPVPAGVEGAAEAHAETGDPPAGIAPLASYIKTRGGDSNQVRRFLVTADWLRLRGEKTLTTAVVARALRDHQQKRLGNPADCLNQNVARGLCEKTGARTFYLTPEGLKTLGH